MGPAGRLLITRPRAQAIDFAKALRRRGLACSIEPLMRIVPETGWAAPTAGIQAIVITSPNAIPALRLAAAQMPSEPLVAAVGPDTAAIARRAGFSRLLIGEGTAPSLAAAIIERLSPQHGGLLHLAGRDVAGDLPEQLGRHGFRFERVTVYRAEAAEALSSRGRRLLRDGLVQRVALFSPRSAAVFVDLVARAGLEHCLGQLTALAISRNAAAGSGWREIKIAASPSREAMIALAADATTDRHARA